MPPVPAVLFDMDGTLVDNMAYHARAWIDVAARLGVTLTHERFEREFAGRKNDESFEMLLGRAVPPDEATRLADEKEALYRSLAHGRLAPVAGLGALLTRLHEARIPCAIATAAPSENRAFVVEALALPALFGAVVGAEHVTRGKPAPDLFLAAAKALGVSPAGCVVFEDAVNGIVAARAAGMIAVGVTTTTPGTALRDAGATWVVRDFASLPDELVATLFGRA